MRHPRPHMLKVEQLTAGYGRGDIVRAVDMHLDEGEIVTIIGPNGAGKSTLIKTIAGVLTPSSGSVNLAGKTISGQRASAVARAGVAFVPQEANVFRTLSVRENLEMGGWTRPDLKTENIDKLFSIYPLLAQRRSQQAGNLSGGERQMVALCMALMVNPRVLLVDEPSAGLSPRLVVEMFQRIRAIARTGVSVLMVEQNAIQALRVSDRGYVMVSRGYVRSRAQASRY